MKRALVCGAGGFIASHLVRRLRYVEGPVGVQSRNFSNERIYSVGWRPRYSLRDGIARTYPWVQAQVEARGATRRHPRH